MLTYFSPTTTEIEMAMDQSFRTICIESTKRAGLALLYEFLIWKSCITYYCYLLNRFTIASMKKFGFTSSTGGSAMDPANTSDPSLGL